MSKIFIPKTCRVGFQDRSDTFTNKLGYVIYYGPRGELRKEASWTGWCTLPGQRGYKKELEPFDFENVPTTGFVLNKGIKRYSWSSFGSTRSMIRIYDPRGIEFEIEPENLVGLLMHTDCSKREIQGDLVYAWVRGDLMLIPCASEEYVSAMNFTKLQDQKVSARALKLGATYITKQESHLIYIGRHRYHEFKRSRNRNDGHYVANRNSSNQHMFAEVSTYKGEEIVKFIPVKSVTQTLAKCVNEYCDDRTAGWVDEYMSSIVNGVVESTELIPLDPKQWKVKKDNYRNCFRAAVKFEGEILIVECSHREVWQKPEESYWEYRPMGVLKEDGTLSNVPANYGYVVPRNNHRFGYGRGGFGYSDHQMRETTRKVTDQSIFFDVQFTLSNGTVTTKWNYY